MTVWGCAGVYYMDDHGNDRDSRPHVEKQAKPWISHGPVLEHSAGQLASARVSKGQNGSAWFGMGQHGPAWVSMGQRGSACVSMGQHGPVLEHNVSPSSSASVPFKRTHMHARTWWEAVAAPC